MKIVMVIGKDQFIGWNAECMPVVVSREHAMEFEHAGDICLFIRQNRKKLNRFLQRNQLHMKIKMES